MRGEQIHALSLKVRIRSILLSVELVEDMIEGETKSSKVGTVAGSVVQFFRNSVQVKEQMKLRSKAIASMLEKCDIKLTASNAKQLLLTWLDTDLLNTQTPLMGVLLIGLFMVQEWVQIYAPSEKVRDKVLKPVNELLFSLSPIIRSLPILDTTMALSNCLPLSLVDEELEKLKIEDAKQKREEHSDLEDLRRLGLDLQRLAPPEDEDEPLSDKGSGKKDSHGKVQKNAKKPDKLASSS